VGNFLIQNSPGRIPKTQVFILEQFEVYDARLILDLLPKLLNVVGKMSFYESIEV